MVAFLFFTLIKLHLSVAVHIDTCADSALAAFIKVALHLCFLVAYELLVPVLAAIGWHLPDNLQVGHGYSVTLRRMQELHPVGLHSLIRGFATRG